MIGGACGLPVCLPAMGTGIGLQEVDDPSGRRRALRQKEMWQWVNAP
jgi:hypothetical protein